MTFVVFVFSLYFTIQYKNIYAIAEAGGLLNLPHVLFTLVVIVFSHLVVVARLIMRGCLYDMQ